jgi:hypothetical protein
VPPYGASSSVGICPANITTPSSTLECVAEYTSQLTASRCIQVPMSDTDCPA